MTDNFLTADALVLREARYKEADRILTLFSPTEGIFTARARGALRKNSALAAPTQQLTYAEMTLFVYKERLQVQEAVIREPFDGLRKNFENYALGCYFAELAEALLPGQIPQPEALQLLLNCLYALSRELCDARKIKAVYELRLCRLLGYTPDLSACSVCGETDPVQPYLELEAGHICCRNCRLENPGRKAPLTSRSLAAMRRILDAAPRQVLAFPIEEEDLRPLSAACEDYLLTQVERGFSTLDYWKRIRI